MQCRCPATRSETASSSTTTPAYDGNDPAANASDDNATAIDKEALLPGNAATFKNYSSYSKGINGIFVDADGGSPGRCRRPTSRSKSAGVHSFGSGIRPTGPPLFAPTSVTVRPGAGMGGSSRVELVWADGAIKNQWLQVIVKADANTGLAADTAFYFGNAIGESGDSATDAQVNTVDEIGAHVRPRQTSQHNRLRPPL